MNRLIIVTPSYNNSEWVEYNLASILNQTYTEYEVLYVDDASTDSTYEKVKEVVGELPNWTVIKNPENKGAMHNYFHNLNNLIEDSSITDSSSTTQGTGNISGDPNLGPLQDNGGPTHTMALLAGSPAIGAADGTISSSAPVNNLDQRGINRTNSDIGAYSFGIQVTTTDDSVDASDNLTSLREAITLANTTAGDDQISFNLTSTSPYIINLVSALPNIIDSSTVITGGTAGTVIITGAGASMLSIDEIRNVF
jgi:CSLREA domain-containing protein